jgi:hypothetical protein
MAWRGPAAIIGILTIVAGMGAWAWRRNQQMNIAGAEELRTLLAAPMALPVGIDAYVAGVGQKVLPLSTISDIRFGTRMDTTPRLVVVPGLVIITTGALQKLRNEGQLAALLAVGITHLEHQLVAPALEAWRTTHDEPMDEAAWLSVGQSAAPEGLAVAMDRRALTLVRAAGYPALSVPQMWAQLSKSPIAEGHPGPLDRLPMNVVTQAGGEAGEAAYVAAVFGPLKRADTDSDRVVVPTPKPARDPFPPWEGTPAQQVALMDHRCGGYTCAVDLKNDFKNATKARWKSDALDCYNLCKADYEREGGSEPGRAPPDN